ncbi:MFS transporter [Ferruginibacter sp. HRS2-29]|uniref:MFS transporter n=1 Tax=Ferruginibacter sp. HRS2-29 TaxID=2487334 RepID=UPI0020CD4666|nr:MFS transporter [Ferruginibacter sp. HRS2-29]MCP9752934.1 MFS transporter [Ferruginibacter sp. HRS2-29]
MSSPEKSGIGKIIFSSSLGTLIEWYDFYIFGSLATVISQQFFPEGQGTAALLSTLAIFAAGFIVRPFGALVFGRIGDLIGRKYTFLLTLVLMGGSTFLIGIIPGYKSIGMLAPILVLLLRLVQGLALGGEYGGAATYVAEHAPVGKRGYYTSWIQTTATLGLFVSLGVILLTKSSMSNEAFNAEWGGWRYPFWVSILLVVVSIYIRMKMSESPIFAKLKSEGKTSKNPLKESFGHKANLKMVLLALFGAVMGQGVIWYTGQFYAQSFLENVVKIEFAQNREIVLWAIGLATPFFLVFGALSDKIGRKWIMLTGMLLGVIFYRPIFGTLLKDADVTTWDKNKSAAQTEPFKEYQTADKITNNNTTKIVSHIETFVVYRGIAFKERRSDTAIFENNNNQYKWTILPALTSLRDTALLDMKSYRKEGIDFTKMFSVDKKIVYSDKILPTYLKIKFIALVWVMIIFVTMVYGPIAAFLVELFPTKIRYTSMSLPYHIGNGVFGGLVPFIATLITTFKGSTPLSGLWYPIGVAAVCFVIGSIYLSNKKDENVMD